MMRNGGKTFEAGSPLYPRAQSVDSLPLWILLPFPAWVPLWKGTVPVATGHPLDAAWSRGHQDHALS